MYACGINKEDNTQHKNNKLYIKKTCGIYEGLEGPLQIAYACACVIKRKTIYKQSLLRCLYIKQDIQFPDLYDYLDEPV